MKLSPELFKRYSANPMGMDPIVRAAMNIPPDKYYSVAMWPPEREGIVSITAKLARSVSSGKISKSDQKSVEPITEA